MKKEYLCMCAEAIGELIIGSSIGSVTSDIILHEINGKTKKIIVALGAIMLGYRVSREFGKRFLRFCDKKFDTAFMIN